MALADRKPTQPVHGSPCSVGELLDTLKGRELAAFQAMLGDPSKRNGWTAQAIFEAVKAEGYSVAWSQIGKHRGGKCRCAK